ncbi:MAG: DEAD/DEAH box helicase [Thermoplasmata archaeon]|nr:MAG: DEAD/DEAH box helicase [Thermoplasmata archaeon]
MSFEKLDINKKLLSKIKEFGFEDLTSIQRKCIPEILNGRDVVGQAETGSGKTLAFVLPILNSVKPDEKLQVLVLTPTRELCVQVNSVFKDFGRDLHVKVTSVFGGVNIDPQIQDVSRSHVVVATPGRLLDHIARGTINLKNIRVLVLDETDKMLEMGFIDDVEKIISYLPRDRQTLMFSATVSDDVHRIARKHLKKPSVVKTKSFVDTNRLNQRYYDIYKQNDKFSLLLHLLKNSTSGLAIVFCGTRRETDIVAKNLRKHGVNVSAIHGGMTQSKRLRSLNRLKTQETDVLVATDVAARGLDIKNVTHVYNYDVPKTSKDYVHRIGRTARAGENGDAVTLLTRRDHDNFRRIQSNKELRIELADFPKFKKVPFFREGNKRKQYFRKFVNRSNSNRI